MDSDGETVYRVPQFNMVAHGAGHINYAGDEGLVSWVRRNKNFPLTNSHKWLLNYFI